MTISKASSVISTGIIILTCVVAYFVFELYQAIHANLQLSRNKEVAVELAYELMDSSKQLTSNVRSYAATGDETYEKTYFNIVDERAGKIPRSANRKIAPGEKIALTDLMKKYGVTPEEFVLVEKGNQLSNALIALETEAMNAVKGIYKDAQGNYDVKGEPNMKLAVELVFGPAYNEETTKIMAPLNEFFAALEKRTGDQVAISVADVRKNIILLSGALALTLALSLISGAFTRKKICLPLIRTSAFAEDVVAGNYSSRIEVHSNNEIGMLGTALNAMLDKLESQLAFSRGVLTALPVPCAVFDTENKLIYANKNILEMFGHSGSQEAYLGQTSGKFFFNDDGKSTYVQECLEDQQEKHGDFSTSLNGKINYASVFTNPMFNNKGALTNAVTVLLNTTTIIEQQKTVERASEIMRGVASSALELISMANTACQTLVDELARTDSAASETAGRMHETLLAMEQMNMAVLDISKNAGNAAISSDNMRDKAMDGQRIVDQVVSSITMVQKNSTDLRADMERLSEEAQSINQIMTVISDIADQTNLLALNAAIEAARAGEAGRGFAVVADEVRKLAEKTMSATTEVGSAIENIQQGTHRNMAHVDRAVTSIEEVTGLAHTSGDRLKDIVEITALSADMVRAIATASEEQSASSAQINSAIEAVDSTLKDVSGVIADANETVKKLNSQMFEIQQLMDRLKA